MTVEHFQKSLNALVLQTPSRPFTVELQNGRKFEVDQADAVAFRDGGAGFIARGGIPILFDHNEVIAIIADTEASDSF